MYKKIKCLKSLKKGIYRPTLPNFFINKMFTLQTKKERNMKTLLRLLTLVILSITITCCTNTNNKPSKVIIDESIVINIDSTNDINTANYNYERFIQRLLDNSQLIISNQNFTYPRICISFLQ